MTHTILTCHPRNYQCSYGNMICQLRTPPQKFVLTAALPLKIAGGTKDVWRGWYCNGLLTFHMTVTRLRRFTINICVCSERKAPILVDILSTDYQDCSIAWILRCATSFLYLKTVIDGVFVVRCLIWATAMIFFSFHLHFRFLSRMYHSAVLQQSHSLVNKIHKWKMSITGFQSPSRCLQIACFLLPTKSFQH